MKDMLILILLLAVGAGWVYYVGHSHTVQMRYNCGIEVPWHEAFFLKTDRCPGDATP
jgi:hypothetical protein